MYTVVEGRAISRSYTSLGFLQWALRFGTCKHRLHIHAGIKKSNKSGHLRQVVRLEFFAGDFCLPCLPRAGELRQFYKSLTWEDNRGHEKGMRRQITSRLPLNYQVRGLGWQKKAMETGVLSFRWRFI